MNTLHIADDFTLPPEVVTQTLAILAKRGVGKTYTAAVLTEEMLTAGLHVVVLDPVGVWWGLRSSSDGQGEGLPIVVLGGDHADLPLSPQAGAVVADFVVDTGQSAVLDVSDFTQGEQSRFMTAFAEQLYQRKARERAPLHLVLDEADAFIPQVPMPDEKRMLGAMDRIVRRGRARGLGITLISQRPAVINKNVLTQTEVLVTLQMTGPQDQKAIETWVSANGTEAQKKELMASLASLPVGTAWVWSPSWLKEFRQIQVRARRTFDSSATPKVGDVRREPTVLAPVDLEALRARMAASMEEVLANDPATLKAQIAELKKQIEKQMQERQPEPVEVEVVKEVPVYVSRLEDAHVQRLTDKAEDFRAAAKDHINLALELVAAANEILTELRQPSIPEHAAPDLGRGRDLGEERGESLQPAPKQVMEAVAAHTQPVTPPPPKAGPTSTGKGTLSRPQQAILNTLAQLAALGLPQPRREHVAVFAGQSPKSSAFTNNLGALRTAGLIDYPASGLVTLTQAGQGKAAPVSGSLTRRALHDGWLSRLPAPQQRILRELIGDYPNSLSRESLANYAGASATSSAYTNNLGALRSLGLIDYPAKGEVAATSLLFPKGLPE